MSLDELIGPDHVCRVIAAFVATLDLAGLGGIKACIKACIKARIKARIKGAGRPPYDPADLLALHLRMAT